MSQVMETIRDALVGSVVTFNHGIELGRLSGISAGHDELLPCIDAWSRSFKEAS